MAQLTVRGVARGDTGGLAQAWEDARDYYAAHDDRAFNDSSPTDEGLADWLIDDLLATSAREDCFVAVADLDGAAVGFVVATIDGPSPLADRQLLADLRLRRASIDALAVQRAHWRRGIGRTLVCEAELWSRRCGAGLVRLTTYAESPVSVPFYDTLGYERRSIVFLKYLDGDAASP